MNSNDTLAAVATSEKPFADAFINCAAVGLIVFDPALRVISLNQAARDILGLGPRTSGPAAVLPAELLGLAGRAAATRDRVEYEELNCSGKVLTVQAATELDAEGDVAAVRVEFQDRDGARAIQANLEHLDRLASLGSLAASAVHEMKNALVAVRTYFELATDGRHDSELCQIAFSEVQRIERSARQLLRGARREDMRMAEFSVHALLQDSLNLLRHEFGSRSVEIKSDLTTADDRVNGDERQLRHAFINLLMNAAEAIHSGGELIVTTRVVEAWERAHFRVSFTDSGAGIAPENLSRIFAPFFTTKPDGTGLGLAISRRIVESHNGALTVESQPGGGTTFHLFLPSACG